jgi:hypothetical protein
MHLAQMNHHRLKLIAERAADAGGHPRNRIAGAVVSWLPELWIQRERASVVNDLLIAFFNSL